MSKRVVRTFHAVEQAPKKSGVPGMIDRKEWRKLKKRLKQLDLEQECDALRCVLDGEPVLYPVGNLAALASAIGERCAKNDRV